MSHGLSFLFFMVSGNGAETQPALYASATGRAAQLRQAAKNRAKLRIPGNGTRSLFGRQACRVKQCNLTTFSVGKDIRDFLQ
jgi:hypothetical protein